jgi:hypothetical protein
MYGPLPERWGQFKEEKTTPQIGLIVALFISTSKEVGDADLYAALFFAMGALAVFGGFRVLRQYRLIIATPPVPIRGIVPGLVRIHGAASDVQTLNSPVSGTPCFFYKVIIDRWKTFRGHRGSWTEFATDTHAMRFHLADQSGKVLIDPSLAEYDLPKFCVREIAANSDRDIRSTAAVSAGRPSDAALFRYVTWATSQKLTTVFHHLLPGGATEEPGVQEEISRAALEHTTNRGEYWQSDGKLPTSFPDPELNRLYASNVEQQPAASLNERLVRSSHLGDLLLPESSTKYRLTEYCILPAQEYDITGTCVEDLARSGSSDARLVAKGSTETTFLISSKTGKEVEATLRNQVLALLVGGAAIAIACLAFLLTRWRVP